MGSPDYTTEHQKGKHLTYEDYVKIQVRLQDGWSANRIAVKELHCSPNTVRKIIRQGMTPLYHGKVQRFKAKWLGKFTKRIAAAAVVHTRPKRKRRFFPTWNPTSNLRKSSSVSLLTNPKSCGRISLNIKRPRVASTTPVISLPSLLYTVLFTRIFW